MSKKVLVVEKDCFYDVNDVVEGEILPMDIALKQIDVSDVVGNVIQMALDDGKKVGILKTGSSQVRMIDLVIDELDEVEMLRRKSIREIQDLIQSQIFSVGLIDSFDFLEAYMKMINKGIIITDDNREDMYFKVIEQSQEAQEPEPLKENSSFEDEQRYVSEKNRYEQAQDTLKTLESYLNGYDKLKRLTFINNILTDSKEKMRNAKTADEINSIKKNYVDRITNLFYKNTK